MHGLADVFFIFDLGKYQARRLKRGRREGTYLEIRKPRPHQRAVPAVLIAFSPLPLFICTVNLTVKRLVRASRWRHVMSCGVLAPRYEASNISSDNHLPTNA